MAFNLLTKMQNLEVERTGKEAPSKPMLKAGFSNPEALITAMAQLFLPKSDYRRASALQPVLPANLRRRQPRPQKKCAPRDSL